MTTPFDIVIVPQSNRISNCKYKKTINTLWNNPVTPGILFPYRGAPHNYIYNNTDHRGQIFYKVCDLHFSANKVNLKNTLFICSFCIYILSKNQDRKNFYGHKCVNKKCDLYLNSLAKLLLECGKDYKKHKHKFNLHYIYGVFTTNYLYVNLGLSRRHTSRTLLQIHGVKISNVMISRYTITAAGLIKPLLMTLILKSKNILNISWWLWTLPINHF